MTADHDAILEALGNVRFRFWTCPVREHAERNLRNLGTDELVVTVEWRGDIAYCTAPNCEQSSAPDGREAVTERPYTDADVDLIEAAWDKHPVAFYDGLIAECRCGSREDSHEAKVALMALAAAGRLAPADDDPRHIIEFRHDGWTIKHPLACRPKLFECPFNRAALDLNGPPAQLGRFVVDLSDEGQSGDLIVGDRIETVMPS